LKFIKVEEDEEEWDANKFTSENSSKHNRSGSEGE
jgi:hypothetical protein